MLTTKFSRLYRLLFVCLLAITFAVSAFAQGSSSIVISQVYGGGGANTGTPTYKNDYIELHNVSAAPIDLSGYSVQYGSATGTGAWGVHALTTAGVLQPGQYILLKEGTTGSAGADLLGADATGGLNLSGSAGKVALVVGTTALVGCTGSANLVDFVAYGSTNCSEGSPTPALSTTTAALRNSNGCTDTNNNAADFTVAAPAPRNSASPYNVCAGGPPVQTNPSGVGLATPASVIYGTTTLLTVTVTPGANPASTGLAVAADLSAIGGAPSQTFYDDGTNGDVTAGDNKFSYLATVPVATAIGAKTLTASISDAQSRTATATISVTVKSPATFYAIHDIRAQKATLLTTAVQTTGIVTYRRKDGFYLQEKNGTFDGVNSLAIYVYTGSTLPAEAVIGNELTVSGTLGQYPDPGTPTELEIKSPTVDAIVSTGNALPAAITIVPDGTIQQATQFEKYTGMLATMANTKVVGPTNSGAFYVTDAGVTRPFREPGIDVNATVPPGAGANVPRYDSNPEVLRVDMSGCTSPADLAVGDVAGTLNGAIGYYYSSTYGGAYSLFACKTGTTVQTAAPITPAAPSEFTVASFNMWNFAGSATQTAKASMEIIDKLNLPTIIGVEEVKDLTSLQGVATKVNTDAAALGKTPNYQAVIGKINGTQNIGFLYRGDQVTVTNTAVLGNANLMAAPCDAYTLWDRQPFQMDATITLPGRNPYPLTIMVNHLRSLIDVDTIDVAPAVKGSCARLKRSLEAEDLAQWLSDLQQQGKNLIVVGDMNAFDFNDGYVDVLGALTGNPAPADQVTLASTDWIDPNLTDLIKSWPDKAIYTYVENGSAQSIDHIVVNDGMLALPHHVEVGHVNADFPVSFSSNAARPERVSDHDQPVAYFQLPVPQITVTPDNASVQYGSTIPTLTGTISGVVPGDNITATYTTDATPASAVGTYQITATLNDPDGKLAGYGTSTLNVGTLTITQAPLTITVDNKAKTYGAANPELTGTIVGLQNSDNITALYSTPATAASTIGDYPITATLQDPDSKLGNYAVTKNAGTLTVSSAVLTIITNNKTRVYNTANPTFDGTVTGLVNGDVITAAYTTTATQTSNAGTYAITATLTDAGNKLGNYAVTNAGGTLTITAASTTTAITSSKQVVNLPGSLTLTATVTSPVGTPTGTVTFYLGTTSVGTATLDNAGKATLTLATPTAVGKSTVSAKFETNQNFTTSTSSNLTQYIYAAAPDYSLTATPTTLSLHQGQSGLVQLTMTPTNGFNGNVTFNCTGLPQTMSCVFTPGQLTGNLDNTPVTGTLTITTMAPAHPSTQPPVMAKVMFTMSGFGLMGIVFAGIGGRRSKRNRVLVAIIGALVLMLLLSSCGSPNSFASPGATAPGTVTTSLVATATAGTSGAAPASHQVQIVINVTQ